MDVVTFRLVCVVQDARPKLPSGNPNDWGRERPGEDEDTSNWSGTWFAYNDALSQRRVGERETEHYKMADTRSAQEA